LRILIVVFIGIFTCSCASSSSNKSDENLVVTGTKVSKSSFKEGELKEIKRKDGESIMDMVMRMQGIGHYPKLGTYSDCSELLKMLRDKNIRILSVEPKVVIVPISGESNFKYEFENEECPING